MNRRFQFAGGIFLASLWMACGVAGPDSISSQSATLDQAPAAKPYQVQLRLDALPKVLRAHVLNIIDVGDLPDGIIDVGDLPDGIIDVGDLPHGIIDVGDLPDGLVKMRPVVPFADSSACKGLLGFAGFKDVKVQRIGVCVGSQFKPDAPCALFACSL